MARLDSQHHRTSKGFTLIELLVAVSIMSMMAVMGWRALAGMQQAGTHTRTNSDAVLTLDAGLSQWGVDLDALMELPSITAIDWDGRAMRITRRHHADQSAGVLVVAWTRGQRNGSQQWLRWQSNPVRSHLEWKEAWDAAALWAQSPNAASMQREVALTALAQWQIYYYRGGAWSNPLSSSGEPSPANAVATSATVPDGVRLVLTIPPPHPLTGTVTRDWARPWIGGVAP